MAQGDSSLLFTFNYACCSFDKSIGRIRKFLRLFSLHTVLEGFVVPGYMSVVSDAIRNNSDLVFYTLKTPPPPRICYEVTNRFASEPRRKGIRIIDEELDDFINQNLSICRFETWMLNNGSL